MNMNFNTINTETLFKQFLFILIILTSSCYAYLNAVLNDTYGDSLFPILIFFSLVYFLVNKQRSSIAKSNSLPLILFSFYLFLSILSVYLPFSPYASIPWFNETTTRLLYSVVIPFILIQFNDNDRHWLTKTTFFLFFSLCIFIILQRYNLTSKTWFSPITPFPVIIDGMKNLTAWNDKFIANWIAVFVWGAIGLLWSYNSKTHKIYIYVCFLLAGFLLFKLPSEGAQLAFIGSTIYFLLLQFLPLNKNYWFYLFLTITPIILPILFLIFTILYPLPQKENPLKGIAGFERTLTLRKHIYSHACELIKEKPLTGYGVGSTWKLPFPQHSNINKAWNKNRLPGGHPHNLFYLLSIEFGILGMSFFFLSTTLLYNHIYRLSCDFSHFSVALPLFFSYQIITSFSFSVFQADVLLLFSFSC